MYHPKTKSHEKQRRNQALSRHPIQSIGRRHGANRPERFRPHFEQLRTELEALHIGADLDVVVKVSYHPASEISFDDLCSLLTVIHEFAQQVNIVWDCGTDAKLAETDYSILLLIGTSAE